MKCLKCGKYISSVQKVCDNCGTLLIFCPSCNSLVSVDDSYCGKCGNSLKDTIAISKKAFNDKIKQEKELKRKEELEEEMRLFASNIIIDCEGNKFKAIKDFKSKFNVDNEIASEYINLAYDKISNDNMNLKNSDVSSNNSIENIVIKNNYDSVSSIKEVKDIYGYDLITSKKCVDDAIKNLKSSNQYVNPGGIRKTIIVSQSSRKKATSAIGRGIVGNAILGPVGLLAGISAKSKETTTFQVIYNNGRQETVTVKNDSSLFKKYCKYLDN